MSERPILFSGEMVRAILKGRKTQTRRVIKQEALLKKQIAAGIVTKDNTFAELACFCPYGQPSDRLWVREAWKINSFGEEPMGFQYKADSAILEENSEFTGTIKYDCWYERACWNAELYLKKIDYAIDEDCGMYVWENGQSPLPWQPSIFMPRWASRIMLEIVSVRVQRMQDISEEDSIAEGIYPVVVVGGAIGMTKKFAAPGVVATDAYGEHDDLRCLTAKEAYHELWNSINSKRGYSWEKNPWVWAIEFKVVEK